MTTRCIFDGADKAGVWTKRLALPDRMELAVCRLPNQQGAC